MKWEEMIDRYLFNEMGDQEKKDFENHLSQDDALKRKYNLQKDIQKALNETEIILLRNQLDKIHYRYFSKNNIRILIPKITRVAAAVTIIITVSVLVLLNNRKLENQAIYDKYFEPYESVVRVRSTSSSDNIVTKAMLFYDEGKYYEAAQLFEKILATDSTRIVENFYSGISNMEISEYQKANKSFSRIVNNKNNNPFIEQAEWYLGFCYLMTNKNDKAYNQFEKIATSNSFYKKNAKKILRKIKK